LDFGKKYNPIYNLQSMNLCREPAKLGATRGTMAKKYESDNEKKMSIHSTGVQKGFYEIHVKGHLDESWSDWFEGLEVKLLDNGEMILYGSIMDQAALMGVLNKISHLNLTLPAVNEVKTNN
jgi:hypothetical protein